MLLSPPKTLPSPYYVSPPGRNVRREHLGLMPQWIRIGIAGEEKFDQNRLEVMCPKAIAQASPQRLYLDADAMSGPLFGHRLARRLFQCSPVKAHFAYRSENRVHRMLTLGHSRRRANRAFAQRQRSWKPNLNS